MGRGRIGEDVCTFLGERVESFDQLEILLLAHRQPDRSWTAREIGEQLNLSAAEAAGELEALRQRDLLETVGDRGSRQYKYGPRRPSLAEMVGRLARVYEESPVELVRIMNGNAIERVRTGAMRLLADAFILGRKKDG